MQRLEVSCAVRHIYIYVCVSLGAKGLFLVAGVVHIDYKKSPRSVELQ